MTDATDALNDPVNDPPADEPTAPPLRAIPPGPPFTAPGPALPPVPPDLPRTPVGPPPARDDPARNDRGNAPPALLGMAAPRAAEAWEPTPGGPTTPEDPTTAARRAAAARTAARFRPQPPAQTLLVRLTVHLPDGAETGPVDLLPGTPVPQKGDTVLLWDAATGNEQTAGRVTERVLSYFPTPAGPSACEVLLYTDPA